MPTFIAGLLLLYLVLAAIRRFGRMTPGEAARLVRRGSRTLGFAGLALSLFRGRLGFIGLLASALMGLSGRSGSANPGGAFRDVGAGSGGRRASVARTAMIEMRLDLENGAMNGAALAGRYAGRELATLTKSECLELYAICRQDDPDGARLLEAYFDRRFAAWREANEGEAERRGGARGGSGAITRDEAYEILGLAKGASAEEIVAAHRRLMKKLHPDHGGTTALAARVNQAKDVLLDRHG